MSDEHYRTFPRPDPERILQVAIETYLEFIMEQLARIPTRSDLARAALGIIFSTAVLTTLLG